MSDALDRVAPKQFGKKERQEYAIKKKEEEEKSILTDRETVNKTSAAYRDHVAKERQRLGLSAKQPHSMFCQKCFRGNCICE